MQTAPYLNYSSASAPVWHQADSVCGCHRVATCLTGRNAHHNTRARLCCQQASHQCSPSSLKLRASCALSLSTSTGARPAFDMPPDNGLEMLLVAAAPPFPSLLLAAAEPPTPAGLRWLPGAACLPAALHELLPTPSCPAAPGCDIRHRCSLSKPQHAPSAATGYSSCALAAARPSAAAPKLTAAAGCAAACSTALMCAVRPPCRCLSILATSLVAVVYGEAGSMLPWLDKPLAALAPQSISLAAGRSCRGAGAMMATPGRDLLAACCTDWPGWPELLSKLPA